MTRTLDEVQGYQRRSLSRRTADLRTDIFAMGPTSMSHRLAAVFVLGLTAMTTACGSGNDLPETITREVFIDTYVDLRMTALNSQDQRVDSAGREQILAEHGVTADDLTLFADVHGAELEFMRDVWNDIEVRLDQPPNSN